MLYRAGRSKAKCVGSADQLISAVVPMSTRMIPVRPSIRMIPICPSMRVIPIRSSDHASGAINASSAVNNGIASLTSNDMRRAHRDAHSGSHCEDTLGGEPTAPAFRRRICSILQPHAVAADPLGLLIWFCSSHSSSRGRASLATVFGSLWDERYADDDEAEQDDANSRLSCMPP
jgi:hypothetical protein